MFDVTTSDREYPIAQGDWIVACCHVFKQFVTQLEEASVTGRWRRVLLSERTFDAGLSFHYIVELHSKGIRSE